VRTKLDENIPVSAGELLRSAGHDVDSVVDEGLAGATDSNVLAEATARDRLVITLDRGFADARVHPPGSHAGIIVLRVEDQSPPAIVREIEELLTAVELDNVSGCVSVFRAGAIRLRLPGS
jgi:predicted nuclease of predicted toxin-antitoxin system